MNNRNNYENEYRTLYDFILSHFLSELAFFEFYSSDKDFDRVLEIARHARTDAETIYNNR